MENSNLENLITEYIEHCKTDPLYQGLTLEEAKLLKSSKCCKNCLYSDNEQGYRCISPNLPCYYEENNCPYFKNRE